MQQEERLELTVEPELMEKLYTEKGCGCFANGLLEEWVKEVFQMNLLMVKNDEKRA